MVKCSPYPNGHGDNLVYVVVFDPSRLNHQILNCLRRINKVKLAMRVTDKIDAE